VRVKQVILLLACVSFPLVIVFCSQSAARARFHIQDLEYALTLEDPVVRLGAVAALKEEGEAGIPGLAKAARDPDSDVRKAAIAALGEIGGQPAADALAQLLNDPDPITRTRAILAMGMTGRPGFAHLLKVLETEPLPRGRMFAAGAIGTMVEPGDAPAIVERFDRQDAATQMHLVIALVRVDDDQAYCALNRLIESPSRLVRFYVVNSLAEAPPDARALPVLINSLDDEASEVRMWGIFGLERLNHPESFTAVLAALGDEDAYVRKEAAYTLGTLGKKEAIPFLIASLKDPTTMVRGDAATALGFIGDPAAAPHLKPLLSDANPGVRIKSSEALARLGSYDGVEILIGLVDSPARVYAQEAVRALQHISSKDFGRDKDAWRNWWNSSQGELTDAGRLTSPR
jgi:HEAT repeat protein